MEVGCTHIKSGSYCKICSEKPEKKKPKPIRKVSLKRQKDNPEYAKIRDKFIYEHPTCEICKNGSSEVHHKKGRIGGLLTDVNFFMAVCPACHKKIHENVFQSFKNGWMVLRSN